MKGGNNLAGDMLLYEKEELKKRNRKAWGRRKHKAILPDAEDLGRR